MADEAWNVGFVKCFGMRLAGDIIGEKDEHGEPIVGDTLLVLLNAHHEPIPFTLPAHQEGQQWEFVLDTADGSITPHTAMNGEPYKLQGRSLAVLRIKAPMEESAALISPLQAQRRLSQSEASQVPSLSQQSGEIIRRRSASK